MSELEPQKIFSPEWQIQSPLPQPGPQQASLINHALLAPEPVMQPGALGSCSQLHRLGNQWKTYSSNLRDVVHELISQVEVTEEVKYSDPHMCNLRADQMHISPFPSTSRPP